MNPPLGPVVLVIRDGWGENHNRAHDAYNAVKLASTPVADGLTASWPRTELVAHGPDVGLPPGVMGNSEVGHQNIGAGRIVDQEIRRIDRAFEEGTVAGNAILGEAVAHLRRTGGKLHLFGLVSDAGVHAMLEHLYGLLRYAKTNGLTEVFIHAFTDGRDTPPTSGLGYVAQLEDQARKIGVGRVASISGRFWAMDRDNRWERVQKAYDCLTGRKIERTAPSATQAIQAYYDAPLDSSRKGDEFIPPTVLVRENGQPVATVGKGDAVVFFNFRGDRPRELTRAFIDESFAGFERGERLQDLYYATMTEYQEGLCPHIVFPKPPKMPNILGSFVSDQGLRQFRCAETEKFPHVTFFFNDYREEPFPGEERQLIQSPKEVATYDLKPEMGAEGVCQATEAAIRSGRFGLIVVNFANADMVGHTGSLAAAIAACEKVDACVGRLLEAVEEVKGRALVTADHGNSDQMKMEDGSPHTAHTLNPVEVVIFGEGCAELKLREGGRLADIAPTILKLMGLPQPAEMTGQCLIVG